MCVEARSPWIDLTCSAAPSSWALYSLGLEVGLSGSGESPARKMMWCARRDVDDAALLMRLLFNKQTFFPFKVRSLAVPTLTHRCSPRSS